MPANADSRPIGDAHLNRFVDRRFGRRNDLFDKRVVHRFRVADDRHRCRIHDRVPLRQQHEMS